MKLALYQSIYNTISPMEEWADGHKDYVRVSEFVEVEFHEREPAEVTAEKVAQLDKVLGELMSQIEIIQAQKQELLALSYEHE
ncbi:MAG: hypothetical protein M0R47_16740 [Methylobacter sp.]|uniref:hypothetical protein n=1 Tax=Methylobacter sp. TaxID=2051955 RepID=UPI0025FE1664|nr:hypothetical protein [Methylobacter sp.]MCK9622170.1 hypothetical protein [Methylobacter sp.]